MMQSRKIVAIGLAAYCLLTALATGAERQPISDFALPDFRGAEHRLADYHDQRLVVVAFLGVECPLAKLYGPRLARLAQEYGPRGVAFVGINPNQQDSLSELATYARQHGIEFPLLKDLENKVADRFGAERTPEVFVLDREHIVRYQGRIDDQWGIGYVKDKPQHSELQAALDELLSGQEVSVAKTDAVGCLIGRVRQPDTASAVTYSSQIAALFQRRCVECHRRGDIGPFALTSYDEAVGWAGMIEEVVEQGRMPPWHASPKYGHFADARTLTAEEKSLIRQWVAAGAPSGDISQAPPLVQNASGWQMSRPPDVVLKMRDKPFDVPATGEVRYQFFVVDPGFTEDKWVEASEVLPGNRAVVHHVLVFARGGVGGERPEELRGGAGGGFLSGYVPGMRARPFPAGMAKRIPAGSKLVFQVHYTTNGTPQTDLSQLGLWLADGQSITHEVKSIANAARRLAIPPHDSNYLAEATTAPLATEGLLLSMSPHMHLRGKDFRYNRVSVDGQEETLLDVPHYDFNWQSTYRLIEPLKLPAGTQLHSIAHFDNSAENLSNPDPNVTVRWGDQTWEEMMIGYFDLAIPRTEADKVAVEGGGKPTRASPAAAPAGQRIDGKLLMTLFDKNQDGKISREEAQGRLKDAFELLDRNQDGVLTPAELTNIPGQRGP